jgi:hypothetical protein
MSEDREQSAVDPAETEGVELEEFEAEDEATVEPDEGDGGGDDGSDEQAEGVEGPDGDARQSRQERTVVGKRSRSDEVRALRERAQRAETERALFERQLLQVQQQGNLAEQRRLEAEEAERVKFMQPEERITYEIGKLRREYDHRSQQTELRLWDRADHSEYQRELSANPKLSRFNDRVEELRKLAPGVSRLDLLDKAIGEAARRQMGAARNRQERRAETNIRAQTTTPPGGRGNVAAQRQRSGARSPDWSHMRDVSI